jgi:hypothetical protein
VETADEIVTRQDLYGRAAQLAFELDQPDRALELADQGLRLPAVEGPFRRQLFIMAAKVKAARGDNAGSAEAVRAARESLR